MTDEECYGQALKRVQVGRALCRELLLACPDSQQDEQGARSNAAARKALHVAVELINTNPPRDWTFEFMLGHWSGLMEAAQGIISGVELEMYDPRSHPERYSSVS